MDDPDGMKTMLVGFVVGGGLAALSYLPAFRTGETNQWFGIGLLLAATVFMLGWFFAVRRGFRLGKPTTKLERRAKEKQKAERAKKMKLLRR